MATFDYAEMQAVADELITEFGQQGTVTRITSSGPSYDPTQTTTEYPCRLVIMEIDISKVDGTLIEATDKMGYVSVVGLPIALTTADKITIDGKPHAMKIVKPLSPAGTTVVYEIIIAA
ncbi:hypothetical protein JZX87_10040 [Agrobacterium sp. Ap1]|uniref:hypothetical protein n=1 Tax=Agrobacterium sp. Ap1 TaxID=2815337 RepID=UPI001A8F377F|nr:hypothetical protein [Agrobacterium sp. Ap1]MBO0141502.1 hypothetical protein [Agrobacterium sp. Ap1]